MRRILSIAVLVPTLLVLAAITPARAEPPRVVIDKAKASVESILGDDNYAVARDYLAEAKGVLVVPNLIKAGLIIGGETGDGVVLARDAAGNWSDPAFYYLAAASIGLQIGVESKETLFIIMTDKGLNSLLTSQFKMGADVSFAAGPVGGGRSASTVGSVGADFIAFSKSKGLFGGGALDGALIKTQPDANEDYYGSAASPKQILIERRFTNPYSDPLKTALARDRSP